jgi:hypothetical protein
MSTPTPRTDDAQWGTGKVTTDFARTLERELAELLAVNATGAARLAHATAQLKAEREKVQRLVEINEFVGSAQLKAEREKVRVLRLACERIVAEWDSAYDANPIGAGGWMYSLASKALAATAAAPPPTAPSPTETRPN